MQIECLMDENVPYATEKHPIHHVVYKIKPCLYHVVHPPAACSHMVLTAAIFVTHLHKKTEGKYLLKVKKDTNLPTKNNQKPHKKYYFFTV